MIAAYIQVFLELTGIVLASIAGGLLTTGLVVLAADWSYYLADLRKRFSRKTR